MMIITRNLTKTVWLLAAMSLMVFACSKDDDDNGPLDIVGTWTTDHISYTAYVDGQVFAQNDEDIPYAFRFNKDNTGEILNEKEPFNYTLTGNSLTLYPTGATDGEPLTFTLERNGNTLILENETKYVEDGKSIREVYRLELAKQ